MDPLESLSPEQLLTALRKNKTEISCFKEPNTFLRMLRDKDLIPEKRYKKLIGLESNQQREDELYELLDWLETEKPDSIMRFWRCAFAPLLLQRYPLFHQLKETMLKGKQDTLMETDKKRKEAAGNESGKNGRKKRSEIMEEEEEEEEEPEEDEDDDDDDDDYKPGRRTRSMTRKRRQQSPSDSSPIKKGVEEDVRNKRRLHVTCGDKEGKLYRDKMAKGVECIFSGKRWFSPSAFEKFCGKDHNKKWKQSIRYKSTPLEKLLKRRMASSRARRHEHTDSESDSDFEVELVLEDSDTETEEEEEEEGDEEEEENREEEGGSSGKCIRTATRWLTPKEFSKEDKTQANSYWKKSILVLEDPLGDLIKRNVLMLHTSDCTCKICSKARTHLDKQEKDHFCSACGEGGSLLCCDKCPRAFHQRCHLPTVEENMLGGPWLCTFCVLTENQRCSYARDQSRAQAMDCFVSGFLLQCHYLLLLLYSSDEYHIFSPNPCTEVPRYSNFIKNPMWLDKIAEKLQNEQYSTVGQFYSDVDLIFKNCAKFNRDNEFGQMGSRLKRLFEEEFQQVFGVKS